MLTPKAIHYNEILKERNNNAAGNVDGEMSRISDTVSAKSPVSPQFSEKVQPVTAPKLVRMTTFVSSSITARNTTESIQRNSPKNSPKTSQKPQSPRSNASTLAENGRKKAKSTMVSVQKSNAQNNVRDIRHMISQLQNGLGENNRPTTPEVQSPRAEQTVHFPK